MLRGSYREPEADWPKARGHGMANSSGGHLSREPRGAIRVPPRGSEPREPGQGGASRQGPAAGRPQSQASAPDGGTTGLALLLREGKRGAEKQGSWGRGAR